MSITIERTSARSGHTRAASLVVAFCLAVLGLAAVPSTAQAAETSAPALKWKISAYVANPSATGGQLGDHAVAAGATESGTGLDRVVTFPNGVGSFNPTSGTTSMTYQGSVTLSGQNGAYSLTLAKPTVAVDATGKGTISADASYVVAGATPVTAPSTRVKLTTFNNTAGTGADWALTDGLRTLTKTPNWAGVQAPFADSAATDAAGYGTTVGRPSDSKSWDPAFIAFLKPAGIGAFFYQTSTANDNKAPAPFVAQAPVATVTSAVSAQSPTALAVDVTGSGFDPSGVGIYVAVGEAGLAANAAQGSYLGTQWSNDPSSTSAKIKADGTFATTLKLTAAEVATLDPAKSYSVYTIKAHGQNNSDPSQSAEVPLAIDHSKFAKKSPAVGLQVPTSVYGQASTVVVSVPSVDGLAPTGTVTLTGAGTQSATLTNGAATFSLPATLAAGTTTVTAAYSGDANYAGASASAAKSVTKAAVTVRRNKISKKPTTKKSGKTSLTVRSTSSAVAVDGSAKVTFTKKGQKTKTKTVTVRNGAAKVTIPKLKKGTWKITVAYSGTASFDGTAKAKAGSVKVTK